MNNKVIQYKEEAVKSVISGIDSVANIVKQTIGPCGRNILIKEANRPPIITNDGVTIAKSIKLRDNSADAGAQLMIQAANKTNEVAGDGTTTTTILTQSMIKNFYECSSQDKNNTNVVKIQKEMIDTAYKISDYLISIAEPIANNEDIRRVATISSGSEEIGSLIAQAFEASGEYGTVIVEDSKSGLDGLRVTQGMKLTNGSMSQFLLTEIEKRKTDLSNVEILVINDKLDSATDIFPILDYCNQSGHKLLILCDDCVNEIINTIVMNRRMGANLNISIVKLPGYGDIKENIIDDICIATGATKMGRDYGINVKEFKPEYLGIVQQVVITMEDTILKFADFDLQGNDLVDQRSERVIELTSQIEEAQENEKQAYQKRIANLTDGVVVIEVGGNSDVEIQDKKLRIEDAINSVISAKEEGIVAGGGFSFLQAFMHFDFSDGSVGEDIVFNSIIDILKQIAINAGYNEEEVLKNCIDKKLGFNALTGQYEDLLKTGVINSVKVDRYSLINAASVASIVITMGGNIIEEEIDNKK